MIRFQLHVKHPLLLCSFGLVLAGTPLASGGTVRVHQAPAGEELSKDYMVQVQGQEVPVYSAKVASAEPARRWKAMDDKGHSGDYFEKASFACFDMRGPVGVKVTCPEPIRSARVLPASLNITPTIKGQRLSFRSRVSAVM